MKKLVLATLAALTLGTALATSSNTAQAATNCVTRAEWRSIHEGQRLGRVIRILGDDIDWMDTIHLRNGATSLVMSWRTCFAPPGWYRGVPANVGLRQPRVGAAWTVTSKWFGAPGE